MIGFNDSYRPKHIEPACGQTGTSDFPYDAVFAKLDKDEELKNDLVVDPVEMLKIFLDWQVAIRAHDPRGLSPIATRTLATAWVINPEVFGNVAGHMVAKSFGISKRKFSECAAEFSRKFGVKNQFQVHDAKNKKTKWQGETNEKAAT